MYASAAPLGSCAKRASIVAAPRIAGMNNKKEYRIIGLSLLKE
jgi:hypothetical protein